MERVVDMTSLRVRGLMEDRSVTGRQRSQVLSVTPATVSQKLNGHVNWTSRDVCALSEFFGVSTDFLFGRSDEEGRYV